MKPKKYFKLFFAFIISVTLTGSCSSAKLNWDYSKEDAGNAVNLDIVSTYVENEEKKFLVASYEPIVKNDLTKNDLIVFDLGNALAKMKEESYSAEYLDVPTMKSCAIEYNRVETDADKTQFTIVTPKDSSNKIGVLVNKEKTTSEKYVISRSSELEAYDGKTAQEEFEERYGRSDKGQILPFLSNALSSLALIIGGGVAKDPATLATGISNFINAIIGGIAGIGEPTLRDLLEKIYEVENRIKQLDAKVTENFRILRRDEKLTQSYINQVLLNQYQQNIDLFETTFLKDIRDRNYTMADLTQKSLRDVSKNSKTITVPYFYNENNVLSYRVLTEVNAHPEDKVITIQVNEFKHTKAKLVETSNIFTSAVMTEFQKDIYEATEGIELPATLTRELLVEFAVSRLVQEFTKSYYSSHTTEATKFMNLVIAVADRFNGISGESILISYENRYKYMFNFGSEMKKAFNIVATKLRNFLDVNYSAALEAALWSASNYETLVSHYSSALDAIKSMADKIASYKDTYSFILQRPLTASLYSSHTVSEFTSGGNHPTHHNEFQLFRYDGTTIDNNVKIEYSSFDPVKSDDHYSLILRMKQLKESGAIENDLSYQKYLISSSVLSSNAPQAIKDGMAKKKINNNPYVFTTEIKHRDLTKDDKNKVQCFMTAKGSDKMHYFNVGQTYGFMSEHDQGSWHATCWETELVDAETGKIDNNMTIIGLEGCYDEGHWYWRTDERFRFNDGPGHKFFYALTYINQSI